jgi:hypothetical protein
MGKLGNQGPVYYGAMAVLGGDRYFIAKVISRSLEEILTLIHGFIGQFFC